MSYYLLSRFCVLLSLRISCVLVALLVAFTVLRLLSARIRHSKPSRRRRACGVCLFAWRRRVSSGSACCVCRDTHAHTHTVLPKPCGDLMSCFTGNVKFDHDRHGALISGQPSGREATDCWQGIPGRGPDARIRAMEGYGCGSKTCTKLAPWQMEPRTKTCVTPVL